MYNFRMIFFYELKKVLRRRLAQVTLLALLLLGVFMGSMPLFAPETSGRNYATLSHKQAAAAALAGRTLDDALLDEMRAAYARCPEGFPPDSPALAYEDIFDLVRSCGIAQDAALATDAAQLYSALRQRQALHLASQNLTAGELTWWQARAEQVELPIRYFYAIGPSQLLACYYTLGVLQILLAAVCLSGVFADEKQRRTDQLLLCSRMGRGTLYLAKLAAGAAVSVGSALLLFFSVLLPLSVFYGLDGWNAAAQLFIPSCLSTLTIGQLVLVMLGAYLAAALLFGAAALFFSELFQNSLASMALLVCWMLLSMMLPIPDQPRLLAQVMEMLPNQLLAAWSICNYRLVPWFGGYLTELQAAPVLYLAAAGLMAALGWLHYRRSQVSGR